MTDAAANHPLTMTSASSRQDWRRSAVTKTMWPGQRGTLRWMSQFGDALVCVRYRRERGAAGRQRYTTVELLIDNAPFTRRLRRDTLYAVRIDYAEAALRARAKALGAQWVAAEKRWLLTGAAAKLLGITDRARPVRR